MDNTALSTRNCLRNCLASKSDLFKSWRRHLGTSEWGGSLNAHHYQQVEKIGTAWVDFMTFSSTKWKAPQWDQLLLGFPTSRLSSERKLWPWNNLRRSRIASIREPFLEYILLSDFAFHKDAICSLFCCLLSSAWISSYCSRTDLVISLFCCVLSSVLVSSSCSRTDVMCTILCWRLSSVWISSSYLRTDVIWSVLRWSLSSTRNSFSCFRKVLIRFLLCWRLYAIWNSSSCSRTNVI